MAGLWNNIKSWEYFNELAFVIALVLILWALKFAKEGLIGDE